MSVFKKRKKPKETSSTKEEGNADPKLLKDKIGKTKKKIKIGFGRKDKKSPKKVVSNKNEDVKTIENEQTQITNKSIQPEDTGEKTAEDYESTDIFLEGITSNEEEESAKLEEKKEWSTSKKRRTIIPKDMKGKPVYLEDTGEKLGTVFDMIYDENKDLIGYKIKDNKSDAVLSFPIDQFDEDKSGLIFVPSWYTKAVKTLEKLEFKERVSPELTTLLTDDAISNEELYNIFVKHDDQMAKYIEEAVTLKELINQRLGALEKQRLSLKDNLMSLTEKRLIKDIDRRHFSDDVMAHRRKANVLDVNIKKCKKLLHRLDNTSFGRLGKYIISDIGIEESSQYRKTFENFKEENSEKNSELMFEDGVEDSYKQKYYETKERFEQLEEDYDELKTAVGRMIAKDEL